MGLLNGREPGNPAEDRNPGSGFLDLYQSRQRCYGVRGITLTAQMPVLEKKKNKKGPYLFILERIAPDGTNLSAISRHWHLSHREEEIVRLLIADKSNKEMAATLGLSINTVKGYLKLLERKMGATSRCGIIARLLTGRNSSA